MNNKYCKHCWPTKRNSHFINFFNYYLNIVVEIISKPFKYLRIEKKVQVYFWLLFLDFLSVFKLVQYIDDPIESKIYNRSLIFFREAKNRNLKIKAIKFFWKYTNEFKFIYHNKNYYYEGIPLKIFDNDNFDMDNKYSCKKKLQENILPTASGKLFTCINKALDYGYKIGFPLVVKPLDGSLSQHVTCNINSEKELLKGIKIAKQYSPAFIVESYIYGSLFRASVVGKKHVFVCQKDRANICGDGISTIKKLIDKKNSNINRADTYTMNTTLHKIPINENIHYYLERQGININTILPKNKKIYLSDKYVLSHGCDIINCNQNVHKKNKDLFLKVANILQTELVGIDFICPDISKPYNQQKTAILEVNSLPYIDMHQFPSHGTAEPVAEIVWDIVLDKLIKLNSK